MVLFIPYKIDIPMKNPKIIAEIGCNHKGDMLIAKELILKSATIIQYTIKGRFMSR